MKSKLRHYLNPEESKTIGVDFDGVIHRSSQGFHDGTIYDVPIEGSLAAIKELSLKYNVVVYTAKARPDRPLINGKTGTQLVREWLDKHGYLEFVSDITAIKPRALVYIDDRAIRFEDWKSTMETMERINAKNS